MKFIIFDIDGTLTDTKKVEDICFHTAFFQTFGLDISNQKWEDLHHVTDWGITEEIIERELGRKPLEEEYQLMISNFVHQLKLQYTLDNTQFSEVEGAKKFFDSLKASPEYKLGIATGSWEKSARLKLAAINIDLEDVCFSNSDFHKSREAIMQDVINQLKNSSTVVPEKTVYFGDGAWDFNACKNLGIPFIGIDILGDGKLKALGAKFVFNDYTNPKELLHIIHHLLARKK